MRRAPWIVGVLLAISVALLIALAGPLLLFNPWFVSVEQARTDVPVRLGTTQAEVDRVTGAVLGEIWTGGDFAVSLDGAQPLLTDAERSHMRDVGSLVRLRGTVLVVGVLVLLACLLLLRREPSRIGALLLSAASGVGLAALLIGLLFAVAFDQAFLAFHEIFFSQGNFLFGPDSNLLRLFPEPFWFDASLIAGASIFVTAVVVALLGWWLLRHGAIGGVRAR
jgi:integral membrane protein (TIGR01906 family)